MRLSLTFLPLLTLAAGQLSNPCPTTTTTTNFALSCYSTPLPVLPVSISTGNRTTPWGSPSFTLPNGTLCCSSLTQVRDGIDAVDAQILELLAQRAGFVREATRFKGTIDGVDVPSRDEEVIRGAVNASSSTTPVLPEIIAAGVFEAIINSSFPFEMCVFGEFS